MIEDVMSVSGQTSKCTAFNNIYDIVKLAGWLGGYTFYVLETRYQA